MPNGTLTSRCIRVALKGALLFLPLFALLSIAAKSSEPGIMASHRQGSSLPPNGFQGTGGPPLAYAGPFFISPSQYNSSYQDQLLGLRPLDVRAIVAGGNIEYYDDRVEELAEINQPGVFKLIGFSSYRDLDEKLSLPGPPGSGYASHAEYLHDIGVIGFTYNTETPPGIPWTPQDEMDNLFNPDPQANSVARFSQIATSHGFDTVIWVPYRYTADGYIAPGQRDPNYAQAFQVMYAAGLSGVGLQEQGYIDWECAADRATAFDETLGIHTTAAVGRHPFMLVHLYLGECSEGEVFAEQSCGLPADHYPWQHCDEFIDRIAADLNTVSVPNQASPELISFLQTLRSGILPPGQTNLLPLVISQ